ncbi:polysaccharide biosynthesis tyrosine autokinase [Microbacterium sp. No. 7]|uniref:polysaccharide biosynthesis tyrosine autokinase n=1 Tax=Microbacterium sp. No. 7 TaxID=1714373 RepID=UPI0006CFF2AC|nr:polysaccharide biosynthesis tyrosine autokinase [Microbacterium sp. No. 7]
MELRDYLALLRSHWLALVATTVLGAALAFGWTALQPRVYTADASGFISTGSSSSLAEASIGDSYAKARAASYVDIAKSRAVAEFVIADLGLDTTPTELVRDITVTNPMQSVTIKVSADAGSPEEASALANAWLLGIVHQVTMIENEGSVDDIGASGEGDSIVRLVPIDSAELPTSPSSPNVRLALAIGALLGLVIGLAYALVRRVVDRRVRTVDGIERELGVPVLGAVPTNKRLSSGDRLGAAQFDAFLGRGPAGEAGVTESFRQLRTNLRYMNVDDPPRVIVVTSPLPGDGKSTVAGNLAIAMAASGQRVILIDGDLRRPTVATTFGLPEGAGLTDVLIGTATARDVAHPVGVDRNLLVIGAGNTPPNPTELLGSQRMHRLLEALSEQATVLVDAPPLLPVTDGAVLAAGADGALVVAASNRTTYEQLARALGDLERVSARSLGVILNRVSTRTGESMGYYRYDDAARETSAAKR